MKKKIEIKLPEHLIKKLQALPETGMGYQMVDLEFKDGEILMNVTVLNSSVMLLDEMVDVAKIENMKLSDKGK